MNYSDITLRLDDQAGVVLSVAGKQEQLFTEAKANTVQVGDKSYTLTVDKKYPVPRRYTVLVDGVPRYDSKNAVGERLTGWLNQGLQPERVRLYDSQERQWLYLKEGG